MRKIKIIEVNGTEFCCGSSCSNNDEMFYRLCNFTEWSAVSQEDYECLDFYVRNQPYNYGKKLIIIEEVPVEDVLAKYIKEAKDKKEKFDKIEATRKKANEIAQKKREETRKKNEAAKAELQKKRDLEKLAQLEAKYKHLELR